MGLEKVLDGNLQFSDLPSTHEGKPGVQLNELHSC